MQGKQRLTLSVLLALIIATIFWSQSRVPALNEKAQMGLRTDFGAIAFDIVLPVNAAQPAPERVLRSAVNWAWTNWKGMAFGLLFAAAALTVLAGIERRSFRRPWQNTLLGLFVGAPLGVCVNCATPIAQGMYAAGARLETALATLISSPSLNAIVLSMAFTLLPWELAAANVAGVLILLCVLPLLVRWFAGSVATPPPVDSAAPKFIQPPAAPAPPLNESTAQALGVVTRAYLANLAYIAKLAIPLMLLAGLLGAAVIELLPFDTFVNLESGIVTMAGIALLATLLPVPIAFNVIVVMALLAAGLDPAFGAVLLFALGVYSIYPAFVIGRYISLPLSLALAGTVVVLATALGLGTAALLDTRQQAQRQSIEEGLAESGVDTYRNAIGLCAQLPANLQGSCFASNLNAFDSLVDNERLCDGRPPALDLADCALIVSAHRAQRAAELQGSTAPCAQLSDAQLRGRCVANSVLQQAVAAHDMNVCAQLESPEAARLCRQQFVNASLLFIPDDSVCRQLSGDEFDACRVNAAIYRFAETRDFEGCETLPAAGAIDHCRFVIASAMVGRNNDVSGCDRIEAAPLAARCRQQQLAWQAERDNSPELCAELADTGLEQRCRLRVTGRRIQAQIADAGIDAALLAGGDEGRERAPRAVANPAQRAPAVEWEPVADGNVAISRSPYRERSPAADGFVRKAANALGITRFWEFSTTDVFEPFMFGKGIATGDFDGDAWPDLALATEAGVALYRNSGGVFTLLDVDQGEMASANLFVVALVDADGDGNTDLFASSYGGRNFILHNEDGRFGETQLERLPGEQRLTMSAGFADIDGNGGLDIVLGNWSSGVEKLFAPVESRNRILLRRDNGYTARDLPGVRGETNSVLLTDVDGDGYVDLLIGNDQSVPDVQYLGREDGRFVQVSDELLPRTTLFTMSLAAADFDNDLRHDIFATDMTFAQSSRTNYCDALNDEANRLHCTNTLRAYEHINNGNARDCRELEQQERRPCYAAFAIKAAKTLRDPAYCENLAAMAAHLESLCRWLAVPAPAEAPIDQSRFAEQTQRNVLLMGGASGYTERAEAAGVASSFWSWNAKAADLDDDGWQDIYIGNGFHFGDSFYEIQENLLFRNLDGQRFTDVAADWGVNDAINTPSYSYVDLDLDGDVDIIATGVLAPPRVFVNGQSANNSISFLLENEIGHPSAIGARITIEYGDGRQQMRELRQSGGFLSFDAPVLRFGLGRHARVAAVNVAWPDGTTTRHTGLDANYYYRLRRLK